MAIDLQEIADVGTLERRSGCKKHTMISCPPTCWKTGRTVIKYWNGKFSSARTYKSATAAQAVYNAHITWVAANLKQCKDSGEDLAIRPQWTGSWTFDVR